MNEVIELLMERKSIRAYEEREIPQEIRERILESAIRAPTAGNMVLYSILEVEDQGIKDRLVETCDNQPMIARAPLVLIFLADFRKWMDYFEVCDVRVINEMKGIEGYKPGAGDFMLCVSDALIAAQNAVVAAESMGVGSCYIGDIMENYEIHRELFDLPDYTFPVGLLCFGYPTESQLRRPLTTRFPRESVVFKDRYRRLDRKEFHRMYSEMDERVFKGKYLEGCNNIGQHYYKRKVTSDFMAEMNRSVATAIKLWCGEPQY
ncbi:nitroreductase [Propionigenium maris DSM 9537]|uniref:Nitroreductase n=1 Tax=Propionigenium maris DSM 9537 TaxID=1123000 RepID=A0A9W6GKC2_9FUSO|nr:nitroreductase family protein [Propionigenium maris]GLI55888.1 nitroreductase [Propionigenium maris DSM 9537]